MQSHFFLPLIKKQQIAFNTYSFYFQRPHEFTFLPGQYTNLTLKNIHHEPPCRFFTISSSPSVTEHFIITTKLYESEFKRALYKLQRGEKADFLNPSGGFIFDQKVKNYVFLSGGIGITPFRSMITYIKDKKLLNNITLFASFLTKNDVIFKDELDQIAQTHQNIKIIYTLSNDMWNGEVGRISDTLIKRYVQNIQNSSYMIVGPPEMVSAMEEVVENLGVSLEKIQTENFTGY